MTDDHADPEAMHELARDYVRVVHATYLDHVRDLPSAERGALPLVATSGVTVVVATAQRLHLLATTDSLPASTDPGVEVADEYEGVTWTVRFYDPSVLPELGTLTEDTPGDVRRVLGIAGSIYHLTAAIGGGLSAHDAQHSGVALADQHAQVARDLDRLRRALPGRVGVVDELGACVRFGLDRAAALLVADLTFRRVMVAEGAPAIASLAAVLDSVTR